MGYVAILGANGTTGSALARRLVNDGRSVLLLGRNSEALASLSEELQQPWAVIDASNSESLLDAMRDRIGQTPEDGIVNCIGSVLLKPAHATSDEEFRSTVATNLFSSFAVVKCAGMLMKKMGGAVVLFSSAAADIGLQNHEAISAAKAGVVGLARSAAATYASYNLRFHVVSPGLTKTELTRRIWDNPTNCAASVDMHALGRLGEPEHLVSACAWLLDPANNWMTGNVLHVDGGLAHVIPKRRV